MGLTDGEKKFKKKTDDTLSKAKQRALIRYVRKIKRKTLQEDLDKSYEATDEYRRFTRPPWRSRFNVLWNLIVPGIFTLILRQDFTWYIGMVAIYFGIDMAFYAYRVNKWNRNVKRYGTDGWLTSLGYTAPEDRK